MLNVRLEDIMSLGVVTVKEDATVAQAAHLLFRHRINGILVVERDNKDKIVGVVTTTDLLRLLDKALSCLRHRMIALDEIAQMSVKKICTKKIVTVQKDAKIAKVVGLMHKKKVYTLPVCDGDKVIGVIGRHDILNVAYGS